MNKLIVLIIPLFFISEISSNISQRFQRRSKMTIQIESPAFKYGDFIPAKYTCDDLNISPPLKWSGVPDGTKSFALICDDPDAPIGDWVHWVIYNIPPDTRELKENIPTEKFLKDGSMHGLNDWKKYGYGGPCPPSGVHRYYFKIYALDIKLDVSYGLTKKQLLDAMKGHIIAQGELMGKYQRKK